METLATETPCQEFERWNISAVVHVGLLYIAPPPPPPVHAFSLPLGAESAHSEQQLKIKFERWSENG